MSEPVVVTVEQVIDETPSIRTLRFDRAFAFVPGQFAMIWVPGVDEIPMALSSDRSISVQRVGDATAALCALGAGSRIGVRGPLGRGFPTAKRILAVAGGIGAAPLLPLAADGRVVTFLLGARTESELPFHERLDRLTDLRVATDDGSAGFHGFVPALMETVELDDFEAICVCGPEPMMLAVRDRLESIGALDRSFFSLHRHMKCGVGLCGSCAIDPDGLCVCRDGPVLPGPVVLRSEMGRHARDASGRRVRFHRPG
ncbi:MAG TPA: dihydroorotate dehydrogenase electron transfer subunit [Methanoregulaceae archaeon]|nr:dihydroorotate dehydrogenase electron transfer subunit [Methanoregulaceae archaeon]HQJ87051.1 dihydroorotate dehydrogenase electron transfer subunit [Methanoregulaceae archaeon]